MSLTSIYPMKKKRKLTKDKTPVRKTSRNRDADCSMAAPILGTPSPSNSSIDVDKDIIWDNCSPTQHIPMKLRNQGLSDASDIAQFMKLIPAEKAVNELPPLLGLWMERGHELITENLESSSRQPRAKGRKTRSKVGHLKSDVFSSELCKLAKLMESKQESPVASDKLNLRSSKSYESPMHSRTSTPYHEKVVNTKGKRKSLNASNELWGQDEWFEDEVFLRQATQIEHDVCSQIYNEEKSNGNDTKIINKPVSTVRQPQQQQPKTNSFFPSYKTPVTRKMRREKNDKLKPPAAKYMFTGDINANKTEKKQVCIVPTVPLKPRQLHGTFQNSVRIESENIDMNPNNDAPSSVDTEEVWDDLDDDELVGLESVLDTVSFTPKTLKKPDCQRSSSRKCFRMTKSSAQVDTKITDNGLNMQLAFQKICSPVTRSMTRDQNHKFRGQDSELTNGTTATNNNQHYSQEQIEKKRQLAIQRRKERNQQVLKSTRHAANSKQINQR